MIEVQRKLFLEISEASLSSFWKLRLIKFNLQNKKDEIFNGEIE